jgi:hypothetical protein
MRTAIPMDLALFFVAAFLGAVVAGIAGFAFGLIASAIWLHIIPPAQSSPLIAAFAILVQGATLWKFRQAVRNRGSYHPMPAEPSAPHWEPRLNGPLPIRCEHSLAQRCVLSIYSLARPTLAAVKGGAMADSVVGLLAGQRQYGFGRHSDHRVGQVSADGPRTTSALAENMEAAGSDRRSISKIVLSHAHPDHLWGLLDDFDNTPMFPNAPI